jgi:hypothetical protein
MSVMPVVIILLCAANVPDNIKRFVRHLMLIGITLWGALHLTANGDLTSTIVFASFLIFSILDILQVVTSRRFKPEEPVSVEWDNGVYWSDLWYSACCTNFMEALRVCLYGRWNPQVLL